MVRNGLVVGRQNIVQEVGGSNPVVWLHPDMIEKMFSMMMSNHKINKLRLARQV